MESLRPMSVWSQDTAVVEQAQGRWWDVPVELFQLGVGEVTAGVRRAGGRSWSGTFVGALP